MLSNTPYFDLEIILFEDAAEVAARCVGENTKQTFIVFQQDERVEELLQFLTKILAAVQLDLQKDVKLLAVEPQEQFSFIQLSKIFEIQKLLSFGISPNRMGINFQTIPYTISKHENRSFIFADDLKKILEERQQGGKRMSGELWKALKALFLS